MSFYSLMWDYIIGARKYYYMSLKEAFYSLMWDYRYSKLREDVKTTTSGFLFPYVGF